MIIKGIVVATAIAVGAKRALPVAVSALLITGCASAETKLASKADYRKQQVAAIKVQKEADTVAAQAASAERVAMWNALSEAVRANPEAASHVAIVAAVSSTGNSSVGTATRSNVVQLNKEREEAQAIDYIRAVAPGLIGGVAKVGISAIVNETSRDRIAANRDVRIAEVGVDSETIGAINNAIDELDDNELTPETADIVVTEEVTEEVETTEEVIEEVETTEEVVDDVIDIPEVEEPTDDVVDPVDCDVTFSPAPPECA